MRKFKTDLPMWRLMDLKTFQYDWMFDLIVNDDWTVSCPSIPESFDENKEIAMYIKRNPLIGTMSIIWKQL